jgi:tRNA(fMet)-specific endonuclease VapC
MKYLLDTNILIFLIKQKPAHVLARFAQHPVSDVGISAITVAELEYGVAKSGSAKNRLVLDGWMQLLQRPAFDQAAAHAYGRVRAVLTQRGQPIGPLDTLIAAHALALNVTLVTNNVREFSRVPGLRVEDWTLP